jgi:two-component system sensor kinase FixL
VISDISERKRAEEALRAREAEVERLNAVLGRRVDERTAQLEEQRVRLQAIVDTVAEGIITFDQQGVIDSINAAALQIFGYRAEEVRGCAVSLLVPGAAHTVMNDLQAARDALIASARSVAGRHKEGRLIELELSLSEIKLPQAHRFVAVFRDVSEKRRLETQLRERQEDAAQLHRLRTAGELAGVLAHQLNQPLTAILGFAEAAAGRMRRGAADPDQLSVTLAEIAEQAHRAAQVIRDLRHFLSRERGEMIPTDLNATVQRAYELMSVLANDAGVVLRLDLSRDIAPVPMFRSQIEQVLLILIDNAIDAILDESAAVAPAPRRAAMIGLSTALAADAGSVVVTVRDSGPGLDQARAERIFEPLYTTKINGVGLGLSIARSVIDAHGGRIWAEAGSAGIFHFMLPVKQ